MPLREELCNQSESQETKAYQAWLAQNAEFLSRWVAEHMQVDVELENTDYTSSNDIKVKVHISVGNETISGYDYISLSKE
ncbi:hypothetical protein PHG31p208 [Aeromonas phage 31]|uniref:Uncharacterized protein n=4 Tax=Biquartavirus TaxID=1912143 RepID=Q6U991_9CAUD|nr:hypothetical protein ST44RRORF211c [Aeromonas phage 44RR2.8t]YP_238937.1 hypothetical protein PHG31p208 [Aeromonas phage 31]APU00683.1 hypothetical protein [Aeromonas phage 44RR2.8t.2]APU01102.1 hypothetical protein [Aeromonas phage 31.2]APU02012.1 hypothetical protein [Aeromonas phage L9-6]APU02263.1 hypothetical protein [Aeromonas phage Riv-10]UYD59764.1 hypothetical protein JNMOADIG_00252 [Aeromonas phage avDM5]UYD60506.1 hypothetical protein NPHMPGLK_00171 [Aeromonas phage avDM2]